MKMKFKDVLKEIDVKSRPCYYFHIMKLNKA